MTPYYITQNLAQQIVDTVQDLCGQNVNFIDKSGRIFASTDESRIGTYHEIGRLAAEKGTVIEVNTDSQFTGTQKGVNLPVYHNNNLLAVIGITGDPDKTRKYAHLAEQITRLLIREKELEAFNRTNAEKKSHILRGLIEHEDIHPDYLLENLRKWNLNEKESLHLLRLKAKTETDTYSYIPLETSVYQLFQQLEINLFTFVYPDEYLAVIKTEILQHRRKILTDFALTHKDNLCIAVGKSSDIYTLSDSAFSAKVALKAIKPGCNYIEADALDMELLLASVNTYSKKTFLAKTIDNLSSEDLDLLGIYFSCNMSLKKTCAETYLHKNTLQYRLNKIYHRCGYNPREFQDAVRLYLALKML